MDRRMYIHWQAEHDLITGVLRESTPARRMAASLRAIRHFAIPRGGW